MPTNRLKAVLVLGVVVVVQLFLLLGRTGDVHHRYGFQPFSRSDTISAEIVRVGFDGTRALIDDGTWAYDWDDLVGEAHLLGIGTTRWASDGAPATMALLAHALDWMIAHTPRDTSTRYLEATVTTSSNGRAPTVTILRSRERGR